MTWCWSPHRLKVCYDNVYKTIQMFWSKLEIMQNINGKQRKLDIHLLVYNMVKSAFIIDLSTLLFITALPFTWKVSTYT